MLSRDKTRMAARRRRLVKVQLSSTGYYTIACVASINREISSSIRMDHVLARESINNYQEAQWPSLWRIRAGKRAFCRLRHSFRASNEIPHSHTTNGTMNNILEYILLLILGHIGKKWERSEKPRSERWWLFCITSPDSQRNNNEPQPKKKQCNRRKIVSKL